MTFFENLLLLMVVAVVLLQVARRLNLPYPAMLAAAGVVVGLIPGVPPIPIEPETYLALLLAPVLVDAAFDFPPGATRRYLAPLIAFAVFAVLLTAGLVAWVAHVSLHISWAAGLVLGAIIAPPDAAAASAVLRNLSIPRSTYALLQGESLFNDSTALLLFAGALEVVAHDGLQGGVALRIAAAAPGGILLGIACAYVAKYITNYVKGTLGGNLLQFVMAYAVWLIASHLQLSAVLCVVAFAMTLARRMDSGGQDTRMRVQSYAVWSAVVFTLNVFAFLLMGMQARNIAGRMDHDTLLHSLRFAGVAVLAIIAVRMVVVLSFQSGEAWWERSHGRKAPSTTAQAVFVGWCGMRGFVTMATALGLPAQFPHRDTVVLTAFCVVLATLVLQGITLAPLVRLLKLDRTDEARREFDAARIAIAHAGLHSIDTESGAEAEHVRWPMCLIASRCGGEGGGDHLARLRSLGLKTVAAEREALETLRLKSKVGISEYLELQEQIDWKELTLLEDDDRRIEEI